MTKKNTDTTNVYERVNKSELFAYMNSALPTVPEKERLYRAFLRNVDLFKTIRHGKTVILGSDAAKKYIEEERKHVFLQFMVWAAFVAVGGSLLIGFANTISRHPIITFSDTMLLIIMGCAEILVAGFFIKTLVDKRTLDISEEHVDRGINPDYFEIDFEVGDNVAYHSFTKDDNLVIIRTQRT